MKDFKYRAFISYSHADERWGDWLQRALESYRVPDALVGKETPLGPAPRRLSPIFRDRDDFPAAGNLNNAIQEALAESRFQIVICSPNAAKSRWVNEEIKLFKRLGGQDRTLAVIVAGEPGASAIPGREEEECFPPALRLRVDENGALTSEPAEPIAADARAEGDGRRQALTKLAAGLLGVSLDDLVQREAARRARWARRVMAGSAAIVGAMGALTVTAVSARRDAQTMRGHAENLIEFMLTDLRDRLEPVGKLDVLQSVGEKALDYYGQQNLKRLDGDTLNRRARALLLVGNIHQRSNDLGAALEAYEAAAATTEEQLRRAPDDAQRIFDHAQAVFYVGFIAIERGDLAAAGERYQDYYRLARRLVAIDPDNPKWRLELAYATSNLGSVKYNAGEYDDAALFFEESVAIRRALHQAAPDDEKPAYAFAYALSWLAYNDLLRGHFTSTITAITEQISLYDPMLRKNPENFTVLNDLMTARRYLGEAYLDLGELGQAETALYAAKELADRLLQREPDEARWAVGAVYVEEDLSLLQEFKGDSLGAAAAAERAVLLARRTSSSGTGTVNVRAALAYALARYVAVRGGDLKARGEAALDLASILTEWIDASTTRDYQLIGRTALELVRYETERGDIEKARDYVDLAVSTLSSREDRLPVSTRLALAELYLEAGDIENARRISTGLDTLGLKRPDYLKFKERLQSTGE